jgi:Flp pilus assembly pilin Flp
MNTSTVSYAQTITAVSGPSPTSRFRRAVALLGDESGAATAEYAIATLAAVGLAGLLVVVLRGDDVKSMLTDLIHRALTL